MPDSGKSVYKICREQAGYTQEQAAELLHISVRMLCRYESGEAEVPNDIAYAMVRLYNDNFLGIDHLRRSSELAAQLIPAIDCCDFQTGAIRFYNLQEEMEAVGRKLLRMAEDGRIDPVEQEEFDTKILPILNRLSAAAANIRLAAERRR